MITAGSLTIVAAAALAPVVGSALDASIKGADPVSSLLLREATNLVAAIPAIAILIVLARMRRRGPTAGSLAWISAISVVVFSAIRFALQVAVNVIDLSTGSQWVGPEVLWAIMLWPILWAVMWLVAQRVRLVDAQTILADEARRALNDDHEALRSRVFDHLHGTVTSELVVARVRLRDLAQETSDADAAARMTAIADHIQRIHELEVRRLAHVMVASGLETSLDQALHELASSCEGLCDVAIAIDEEYALLDQSLDEDARASIRMTIYRIVEESLSNALRHAHASHVVIRVASHAAHGHHAVDVTVTNDGAMPSEPASSGVGLRVIRARVGAYDGRVSAGVEGGHYRLAARLHVADGRA